MADAPRISTILIGILILGLCATGFIAFYGGGASVYSTTALDNSSLAKIAGTYNNMNSIATSVQGNTSSVKGQSGIVDLLGNIFSQGYTAVKVVGGSVDSMTTIIDEGVSTVPHAGTFNSTLIAVLGTAVIVIVFIAIFAHFIIKSDRL